jgi:hypothetical protein
MALRKTSKVGRFHLGDASCIDNAIGYRSLSNQILQPFGGIRLDLVVVGGHQSVTPA